VTARVVRTAVSLEPALLEALDRWSGRRGAKSRSDAIRFLIRRELADAALADPHADAVGTVTVLFDHRAHDVQRRLTAAQHRWGEHIRSATHVHLAGELCLEVMVLLGERDEVASAAEEIRGIRGVQQGGVVVATPAPAGGRTGHVHPHAGLSPPPRGRPPRRRRSLGARRPTSGRGRGSRDGPG
jgi:CopG family nickel-responsive transcriptional regulator